MSESITQSLVPASGDGFTDEQIKIIKNSVAKGVSDQEMAYFLEVCRSTGLNPLHRQIYAIVRSGKMTIQTGIDGYRLLAHRSSRHAGTDDAIYDTEEAAHPGKATVTVYKLVRGVRCPFTATARWAEYKQDSGQMWGKFPYLMLAKCAEALALRKAFPAETSGIYTDEEMQQADEPMVQPQIAAPVTVTEEPAPEKPKPIDLKQRMAEIEASEMEKLKKHAMNDLDISAEDFEKASSTYTTVATMAAALKKVEQQRWSAQILRSKEAGMPRDEYDRLLAQTGGHYDEMEALIASYAERDLSTVPALRTGAKGRN